MGLRPSAQQATCQSHCFLLHIIPAINYPLWSLFHALNSMAVINTTGDFLTPSNLSNIRAFLPPGASYFIFLLENSWRKENTGCKDALEGHKKLSGRTTWDAKGLVAMNPYHRGRNGCRQAVSGPPLGSVCQAKVSSPPACHSWWCYVVKDALSKVIVPNVLQPQTVWCKEY